MNWQKKNIAPELVREIAKTYGCDTLTASVLVRRGIIDGGELAFYLEDDPRYLHNPFLFKDMEDAVDRIYAAREEGEKVLIFGDRDADGITSTALLFDELTSMGLDAQWRVPEGDDSYGLSLETVEKFAAEYGSLIITVDCGISNITEIARAAELGIDVIVLDHHNPQEETPSAAAIINPKISAGGYPFDGLSGCSVAYKLACALRFAARELYKQPVCLLNARPVNGAYTIEAVKIVNMIESARLSETIEPELASAAHSRIIPFLRGQQILVWDGALQKKTLAAAFGSGIDFNVHDISEDISAMIPSVAGMSLLRLKDVSRIGKYGARAPDELDAFVNIFISYLQRREKFFSARDEENLQLAAVSTLADIMPLRNENRILVKRGLAALSASPRKGLKELIARQGLSGKKLTAEDISWQISPLLNSAGRMGKPQIAIELLLEKDDAKRAALADELVAMNRERKRLGTEGWTIIEPLARKNMDDYGGRLAFAASDGINRGITGIMASKLSDRFKIPAIAIACMKDGKAFGSMRSPRGYDLTPLLEQCSEFFIDCGGHSFAAGFSMNQSALGGLKKRLAELARVMEIEKSKNDDLIIDAELPPQYMSPDIFKLIDLFEPYGELSEPLVFLSRGMKIISIDIVGKTEKNHVKMTLDCGKYKWPAVFWSAADRVGVDFALNDCADAVFKIARNYFNGRETPQLILLDVKKA